MAGNVDLEKGESRQGEVDYSEFAFMSHPDYKPPIERTPTPMRSDTFHALMTPAVREKVFARYSKDKVFHDCTDELTDLEKEIRDNPTLGTTPQRDLILKESAQQMMDYRIEEAYQIRKSRMFWCCFLSNFFGLAMSLWGLSLTIIFEKYDPDMTLFYCSLILYIPAVVWFVYVYLPCKQERDRRRKMHQTIRVRKHYDRVRHSYYHGHDDSDEEEFAQFEKQMTRKGGRSSGSFSKDGARRSDRKASTSGRSSNQVVPTNPAAAPSGTARVPTRSSLKKDKAPERKASVQFALDSSGKK